MQHKTVAWTSSSFVVSRKAFQHWLSKCYLMHGCTLKLEKEYNAPKAHKEKWRFCGDAISQQVINVIMSAETWEKTCSITDFQIWVYWSVVVYCDREMISMKKEGKKWLFNIHLRVNEWNWVNISSINACYPLLDVQIGELFHDSWTPTS